MFEIYRYYYKQMSIARSYFHAQGRKSKKTPLLKQTENKRKTIFFNKILLCF